MKTLCLTNTISKSRLSPPLYNHIGVKKFTTILIFALSFLSIALSGCTFEGEEDNNDLAMEIERAAQYNNCVKKLSENTYDIAFAGDSITNMGGFEEDLAEYKCVNLGICGDTINHCRIRNQNDLYSDSNIKKIFLLIGINSFLLDGENVESATALYESLIKEIKEKRADCPETKLYLESVLPVSLKISQNFNVPLQKITDFNKQIKRIAEENGATYIDLHSLYADYTGYLKEDLHIGDGLHLKPEAYSIWYDAIQQYLDE